jgi:hypothetical protein
LTTDFTKSTAVRDPTANAAFASLQSENPAGGPGNDAAAQNYGKIAPFRHKRDNCPHRGSQMQSQNTQPARMTDIGMIVFIAAVISTGILVWMGITGHPWPKWLLALTTFL